jgi:hypothetical protein
MKRAKPQKEGWWVSRVSDGVIEVVSCKTGKTICSLSVEDYDSVKDAQTMAEVIALLPRLVTPGLIGKMGKLFPGDK